MEHDELLDYSITNKTFEFLLEKSGITKYNNLPIMKLLNEGKPKTERAVIDIFNTHAKNNVNALTFIQMQNKLCSIQTEPSYSAAMIAKGLPKLTTTQINASAHFYLVTRNLKAYKMEQKAQLIMKQVFPGIDIFSSEELDTKYAIDFALCEHGTAVHSCGIQVKPVSHDYSLDVDASDMRKKQREYKNTYLNSCVHILYYGKDYFQNLPEVIAAIYSHLDEKFNYVSKFNANNDY